MGGESSEGKTGVGLPQLVSPGTVLGGVVRVGVAIRFGMCFYFGEGGELRHVIIIKLPLRQKYLDCYFFLVNSFI